MSLFEDKRAPRPLAERLRPRSLDDLIGQEEVVKLLSAFIEAGSMPSVVFWGPPGSGKTTMSRLLASLLGWEGRTLNATSASVKDIRELAEESKRLWGQLERRCLLFIDEIHRLNKGQQDVLLPIVEAGTLVLAGSTTENPYHSINQALRSRVQLLRLEPLTTDHILQGLNRALKAEELNARPEALAWIAERVGGDLRLAYTVLESASLLAAGKEGPISLEDVSYCLRQTRVSGDRKGDNHYDLASAYQKSMRGSDANAAIYYLARFLESGEDPRFIARRLLVTAAEDVGNADPQAFLVAGQAFQAVQALGLPEARIPLVQATLYVANAPKSNQSIASLDRALAFIRENPLVPVPAHLRDAHYPGAKELGHGKGYVYSHKHPKQSQVFLPEEIQEQIFLTEPPGREATLDAKQSRELLDRLQQMHGEGEWFHIEVEALAADLDWPVKRLRLALNQLVQEKRLDFKRGFRVAESGKTEKPSEKSDGD